MRASPHAATARPSRTPTLDRLVERLRPLVAEERLLHLVLVVTLLGIFFARPESDAMRWVAWLAIPPAVLVPRLALSPLWWGLLTGATVACQLPVVHDMDNHKFLQTYWCLAITLALLAGRIAGRGDAGSTADDHADGADVVDNDADDDARSTADKEPGSAAQTAEDTEPLAGRVAWMARMAAAWRPRPEGRSVRARARELLAWNARWLIGLCFLFATFWKLISPDFMRGDFFHFTLLVDWRFRDLAALLTSVGLSEFETNRELYRSLREFTGRLDGTTLVTAPSVVRLAWVLTLWTLAIEAWVAAAFLSPTGSRLGRSRDAALLLFLVTTYPFAPVAAFAALLAAMGLAQAATGRWRIQLLYLLIFLALPALPVFRNALQWLARAL